MMQQKISDHIKKSGYFAQHQQVLVAVSAGQDSMALLNILYVSRETLGISLGIAHINHGQRPESAEEEAYLRQWAKQKALPIYVAHFEGVFTEKKARDFRYAFFERVMAEQGYTALVTAHHRDDQVETILMKLLRGSRLRHLIGIEPVRPFGKGELIRPLLPFTKQELPAVFHFEDQSNQELTYTRNRLRLAILPQLRQLNPNLDQQLLYMGQEVGFLKQALTDLTKELTVTNLTQFRQQTEAVQYFLLQEYLEGFPDLQLTKAQFHQVLHILTSQVNYCSPLKSDYELVVSYESWNIRKIQPQTDGQLSEKVLHYGNHLVYGDYQFHFSDQSGGLPLSSVSPLCLRPPRAGDRLDLGNFHKKLSRIFIDDKLTTAERQKAIVIEQDGKIQIVLTKHRTYLRKAENRAIMKVSLHIEEKGDQTC